MKILGQHASIPLQADFVNHIVLPNFFLFAPVVYVAELLTAVSLMLGAFVGFFAAHRRAADRQSVAWALQCAERVAVDLFLPARPAAHFRRGSLRP